MNVLVYSEPDIWQQSVNHALASLRSILVPHYTVRPITQHSLTTEPWQNSCALLVMPRGQNGSASIASKQVKDFLEAGGAYLVLGTGATATRHSEAPLKLFDNFNNVYLTFDEDVRNDCVVPRVLDLKTPKGDIVHGVYDAEATHLSGFANLKGLVVLARYTWEAGKGAIAGLSIGLSKGRIALWGPGIEYPLQEEPVSSLITKFTKLYADDIQASEKLRIKLLRATLIQLRLRIPADTEHGYSIHRPLPQFLTSTPKKPTIVSQILDSIADAQPEMEPATFKDANDEFYFHLLQESMDLLKSSREASKTVSEPSTWQPKHIILCLGGVLPEKGMTPRFDIALFYKDLEAARDKIGLSKELEPWGMGDVLLYGEVVTSTQTMLDKNPLMLSQLPTPLLSIASSQLAGRGGEESVWLSPPGCLLFSLLLRVSLTDFPANKIVFLQYLLSLAAAEACRDEAVLGPEAGEQVRLEWPNGLCATVGGRNENIKRLGGILVTTSVSGNKMDIVAGCGLNILNRPPSTSLTGLQSGAQANLSIEKTAAVIMAKFEPMWTVFVQNSGSFAPFMDLYLKRWLHADQLATVIAMATHTDVRVVGITPDHGLLRTIPDCPAAQSEYIDLQPDKYRFDITAASVKRAVLFDISGRVLQGSKT